MIRIRTALVHIHLSSKYEQRWHLLKEGRKLYRTSEESLGMRQLKKVSGATEWYRKKRKREGEDKVIPSNLGGKGARPAKKRRKLEWRRVLMRIMNLL